MITVKYILLSQYFIVRKLMSAVQVNLKRTKVDGQTESYCGGRIKRKRDYLKKVKSGVITWTLAWQAPYNRERVIMDIFKFIKLSKWFNRKSQHYILGGWWTHKSWLYNGREKLKYLLRYPVAWVVFMWLSRDEYIK